MHLKITNNQEIELEDIEIPTNHYITDAILILQTDSLTEADGLIIETATPHTRWATKLGLITGAQNTLLHPPSDDEI